MIVIIHKLFELNENLLGNYGSLIILLYKDKKNNNLVAYTDLFIQQGTPEIL